ncbi:hypothetical protein [Enterococcus avium]|uniref:hypothetical protein n=1 Tax=Enterococcus avium TaxID=33945 RepID=UPI001C115CD8|nr:hypothetical protein [Enterococcus avium]MBU5370149.1 hypothetical protein [Enterococcus avium]
MELLKLIKNRISSEWKKTFNDNVDILNRNAHDQDQKLDTTNARIDNLVLHSGGDSPNEVVDARVNNKAVQFATLAARLLDTENTHDKDVELLSLTQADQQKQLEQQNNAIGKLMGTYGTSVSIYVSNSRGNDQTGDGTEENPFKTIQMAVNMVPLISTGEIYIRVDSGVYLEDVVIRNLSFISFEILPIESISAIDLTKSDLPVKVRSIKFSSCKGYSRLSGIQIVDTANSPNYGISNEQSGYIAINKCKFAENTKSLSSYDAVVINGTSKVNLYDSVFYNQNSAVTVSLMADAVLSLAGSGNNIGVTAFSATARCLVPAGFATTPTRVTGFGLIITKGTVL